MTVSKRTAIFVAALALSPAVSTAAPIGVVSTGLGTPGSADPNYTVVTSADPSYPGPAVYVERVFPAAYVGDDAASSWVGLSANGDTDLMPGTYDFRTTFDLSGLAPSTAALAGNWASDNGAVMLLNGAATGNTLPGGTAAYQALRPFAVTSGFIAGLNTLDFVVNNDPGFSSPTALRVQISGTAVPEPTTLSVAAAGGLALLRRRPRR